MFMFTTEGGVGSGGRAATSRPQIVMESEEEPNAAL